MARRVESGSVTPAPSDSIDGWTLAPTDGVGNLTVASKLGAEVFYLFIYFVK